MPSYHPKLRPALVASVSIISLLASPALVFAQCDTFDDTETEETVVCRPGSYGEGINIVAFTVRDLTVVVGNNRSTTTISAEEDTGVRALVDGNAPGSTTLFVRNQGTVITGINNGVDASVQNGDLTARISGTVYGEATGVSLTAANGSIDARVRRAIGTGAGSSGIFLGATYTSDTELIVWGNSTGVEDGVTVRGNNIQGDMEIRVREATGTTGYGVDIDVDSELMSGADVVFTATNDISGNTHGLRIYTDTFGITRVNNANVGAIIRGILMHTGYYGTSAGVRIGGIGSFTNTDDITLGNITSVTGDAFVANFQQTSLNHRTHITVDGDVSSARHGIVLNNPNSALYSNSITVNGSITAEQDGIRGVTFVSATPILVNGSITSINGRAIALNLSSGGGSSPVTITSSGSVSGPVAIVGNSDVTTAPGSSITGLSGTAIIFPGTTTNNLDLGGSLSGDVLLGPQSDQFIFRQTASTSPPSLINLGTGNDTATLEQSWTSGRLIGGPDEDTLILSGNGGTLPQFGRVGDDIFGFESLNIQNFEWTINGRNTGLKQTVVAGTATLNLADGSVLISDTVVLDGALNLAGSGGTGQADIVGNVSIGPVGGLLIDAASPTDYDSLRVFGDLALDGLLLVDQTYALTEGGYRILYNSGTLSGTFGTVFGLTDGAGLTQSLVYDYAGGRAGILTEIVMMSPDDTGSKSSASAANYLLAQMGDSSDYAKLGFDVGTMASIADIGNFAAGITPDVLDSAVMVSDGAALRFGQSLAGCDMNFSLNAAESCAAVAGQSGPAMFGEMKMTSANTGTEVGHNFNARSFDMTFGVRLTDADDAVQFGLMSGYAKSGSVSDAYASTPVVRGYALPRSAPHHEGGGGTPNPLIPDPLTPAKAGEAGIQAELTDGLEAETFSLGAYARRDAGWWSLDGTAMVSTSEAKLVRNITPGLGIAEQAQSEFVSRQFNLQGTATLNGLGSSEFWIKPLATVGNRTLQRDGFTESGADLLGLTVDGQTRNVSYAGLGAEIAPDFTDEQGNGFRGLLRVTGLAYAGDTGNEFTARFTNAPGDSSFTYFGQNLDTSVLLEGGFQYIADDGFAIGAEGFGDVNPETGDSSTVGATLQLIKRW